jgi:hypothetical protein
MTARPSPEDRMLRAATIFFVVAVLLHGLDHLRRGPDSLDAGVFWLGSAGIVIEVAVVTVVFMRHRRAPLAAASTGLALALGYASVHLTPGRSWLSDSFLSGDVSLLSWGATVLEITAALALGAAGAFVLRRPGARARATPALELRVALRHPVVATFIIGNLLIFLASLPSA